MKLSKEEKMRYDCLAHSKTRLVYHIIFSTKYRRKILEPIKDSIVESIKYAEEKSSFKILYMNTDGDHIHFVIRSKPCYSISQIVRRIKQFSTVYLYQNQEAYLKKFYWKKNQIWTGGYFASTIGSVSEKTIEEYIKNQG